MRPSTRIARIGLSLLFAAVRPAASAPARAATAPPPAPRGEPSASADGSGAFLQGTVVTRSGERHAGLLRWGGEEAFWDDLLNASKEDLPYLSRQPATRGPAA